jgi:hypothetical protein
MQHTRNGIVLTSTDLAADPFHGIGSVERRRTRVEGFYYSFALDALPKVLERATICEARRSASVEIIFNCVSVI